jgi:hypothetical protein
LCCLWRKIGATSVGEIEKLIGEMQEAKNFLQFEKERIQRETACYTKLAQTASCKKVHRERSPEARAIACSRRGDD